MTNLTPLSALAARVTRIEVVVDEVRSQYRAEPGRRKAVKDELVPYAVKQRERALAVLVRGLAEEYENYLDDAVCQECYYRWKANHLHELANALSPEDEDDLDDEVLECHADDLDDGREPPPSLDDDIPF